MKYRLVVVLLTVIAVSLLVTVQLRLAQNKTLSSQPSAMASSQTASDAWIIECADCPRQFNELSNRTLKLDLSGNPHIAYAGKGLYYAWYDGTGWYSETIQVAPGGYEANLALDGNNYPHIVYSVANTNSLKYAFKNAAGWHIQDVPGVGYLQGYHPSLELDQDGYPHIVYGSTGSNDYSLGYSYQDTDGWHSQTVVTATAAVDYTALDLDDNGNPHLVYSLDYPERKLIYVYMLGSDWHFVDICGIACWYPSIVIDQNGYPHISYMQVASPVLSLQYLFQDADGWRITTVDSGTSIGYFSSLGLDNNGFAHISYVDFDTHTLKYAYQDAGEWHTQFVDDSGAVFTSIAIDQIGRPHIAYKNGQRLKYTYLDAGKWSFNTIDTSGSVGTYSSIALDADKKPHISYSDEWFSQLKFAWRDTAGWHNQAIDRTYPGDTSLDLDSAGYAHISYNDTYELKYAYQVASGWYTETVDGAWSVAGNSMKLDSNGNPHIAYVKPGLMVANKDAAGWHYQTIDDTAMAVSLALDSSDYGHISYIHFGLNYAYQAASGWYTQTVDSSPDIGDITSIALDSAGNTHVAYPYITCPDTECDTTQLNHAWWDGSNWQIEAVEGALFLGEVSHVSMVMDEEGYPHIVYSDLGGLSMAYKSSSGWHIQKIDGSGWFHEVNSLALDDDNLAYVSYGNDRDGELKYARELLPYEIFLSLLFNAPSQANSR